MAEETENKTLDRRVLAAGVEAVLNDRSKGFYLLAESDGRPSGGLLITTEWSDWRNARFWWIQSVYVEKDFRRRGLYTELHRAVEEMANSDGQICGLRLYTDRENRSAMSAYRKLGMTASKYVLFEKGRP